MARGEEWKIWVRIVAMAVKMYLAPPAGFDSANGRAARPAGRRSGPTAAGWSAAMNGSAAVRRLVVAAGVAVLCRCRLAAETHAVRSGLGRPAAPPRQAVDRSDGCPGRASGRTLGRRAARAWLPADSGQPEPDQDLARRRGAVGHQVRRRRRRRRRGDRRVSPAAYPPAAPSHPVHGRDQALRHCGAHPGRRRA